MEHTDWLVDPTVAYLNHGGFGALPRPVADAAAQIRLEVEADPTHVMYLRWQARLDAVRDRVATLIRADAADLVFVANATSGTATVLAGLDLGAGDEVLTTDHRYPAVASQATALAARGVSLVEAHVPVDAAGTDEVVGALLGRVTERTRVVVVDHIASPTGFVFPVRDIVAAVHEVGLPVLVDGAHAPGQIDVDLRTIGADFWVGNLHKWVCSPRACAVLQVAPQWQDHIRPLVASHDYAEGYQPAFDWTGTADPVPLFAIPAALDFWAALGWDEVRRHQRELVGDGARKVAAALGTRVAIKDEHTAAMRLVELPRSVDADEGMDLMRRMTDEHRVTAYLTRHAGTSYVRVCGQLYNRPEDYERLGAALTDVLG